MSETIRIDQWGDQPNRIEEYMQAADNLPVYVDGITYRVIGRGPWWVSADFGGQWREAIGKQVELGDLRFRIIEYDIPRLAYQVVLDKPGWRRFLVAKHWRMFQLRILLTPGVWGLAKRYSPMQDSALPAWRDVYAVRRVRDTLRRLRGAAPGAAGRETRRDAQRDVREGE
jgi:hypothetical protein